MCFVFLADHNHRQQITKDNNPLQSPTTNSGVSVQQQQQAPASQQAQQQLHLEVPEDDDKSVDETDSSTESTKTDTNTTNTDTNVNVNVNANVNVNVKSSSCNTNTNSGDCTNTNTNTNVIVIQQQQQQQRKAVDQSVNERVNTILQNIQIKSIPLINKNQTGPFTVHHPLLHSVIGAGHSGPAPNVTVNPNGNFNPTTSSLRHPQQQHHQQQTITHLQFQSMLRPTFQPVIGLQYKNKIPVKSTVKTIVTTSSEISSNDQQIRVLTPSEIMRTLPNLDEYDSPQQNSGSNSGNAAGTVREQKDVLDTIFYRLVCVFFFLYIKTSFYIFI